MTDSNTPDSPPPGYLSGIEAIRKRPAMYVGSVDFFGLIHYLVCPFALLLAHRPTRIDVRVADSGFEIDSDAIVNLEETSDGRLAPFENYVGSPRWIYEGAVLNALSDTFDVRVTASGTRRTLRYRRGQRISSRISKAQESGTHLSFAPDPSIFTAVDLSPAIFESYLRRMSFLHRGVRFRLNCGGLTQEYFSAGGIRDLFDSISAPYQLLHTPIHITAEEGEFRLELVFAYQSWVENWVWSFINNGRAVEGGTHEQGLTGALKKLRTRLKLPGNNGVVALMSIIYPEAVWQGCIKARIGNPELRRMVSRLVTEKVLDWVKGHPEVAQQIPQLRTFVFPDLWSS